MSRAIPGLILASALLFSAIVSGRSGGEPVAIDPSKGVIEGRIAVSFWPYSGPDSSRLMDPDGLEAHLVPDNRPDEELSFPCGEWLAPAPGKYKFWLEGPAWISPASLAMVYARDPFEGKGGASVSRVIPAGLVAIPEGNELGSRLSLRLLHLTSHNQFGYPGKELSRRVFDERARHGVWMPEGPVIAVLFDSRMATYVGITRPFEVRRGSIVRIWPDVPRQGSDLLVVLERPGLASELDDYDVDLRLHSAGEARAPDVISPTQERLYAVWYGLREQAARLEVSSPTVYHEPADIPLRPGRVESFRGRLRKLPALDVEIDLPASLASEELALEIVRFNDRIRLEGVQLPKAIAQHRFERLPPERLQVRLKAGPWLFREEADLTDGEDRSVVLDPVPIHATGTVYRGEEPHPAKIVFQTNLADPEDELEVATDRVGDYETPLFRSGSYIVLVHLEGRTGPPFLDHVEVREAAQIRLDFHLPSGTHRVRAIDAKTGEGVGDAEVLANNTFGDPERTVSISSRTDADGLAELLPLRPGTVAFKIQGKGYWSSDWIEEDISENEKERTFVVGLHAVGETADVRILLPDGRPAARAEARAQRSLSDPVPSWEGQSDERGLFEIPKYLREGFLLIRHPGAGFLTCRLEELTTRETWMLPPSAALTLSVKKPSVEAPMGWAALAIEVAGSHFLHGPALAWISYARISSTDGRGLWGSAHVPAAPLRILAWKGGTLDPAELSSVFDALATDVPWPRSGPVEVSALQ